MNCAEMEEVFPELLEGGKERVGADATRHLETCDACRTRLTELELLWKEMDMSPQGEDQVPPPPSVIRQDLAAISRASRLTPVVWLSGGISLIAMHLVGWIKTDWSQTSALLGPGVSILFFGLAAVALQLGLQLSGLAYRRGVIVLATAAVMFLLYGVVSGMLTPERALLLHPEHGPLGVETGTPCLIYGWLFALPVMLSAGWVLRSAKLPTVLSGVLIGTGAGFIGAGLLHLDCPITTTSHLLLWHGGVILANLALAGALGGLTAWYTIRTRVKKAA